MVKKLFKKMILSNGILTNIAMYFRRIHLKWKREIRYNKGAFIGFSTVCEGKNGFARNSSIVGSFIGYGSYIAENSKISKTRIGRYSSIGPNVKCIFGKHPANTFVSTHPSFFSMTPPVPLKHTESQRFKEFEDPHEVGQPYSITIGNDAWLGANVCIMDGVIIGDGAIVAANALVVSDVEPYTIVGGVPAKPIKKRFGDLEIEFLLHLKWWDKSKEWIQSHAMFFSDIKELQKKLTHG